MRSEKSKMRSTIMLIRVMWVITNRHRIKDVPGNIYNLLCFKSIIGLKIIQTRTVASVKYQKIRIWKVDADVT